MSSVTTKRKTPISYYGGKQMMVKNQILFSVCISFCQAVHFVLAIIVTNTNDLMDRLFTPSSDEIVSLLP